MKKHSLHPFGDGRRLERLQVRRTGLNKIRIAGNTPCGGLRESSSVCDEISPNKQLTGPEYTDRMILSILHVQKHQGRVKFTTQRQESSMSSVPQLSTIEKQRPQSLEVIPSMLMFSTIPYPTPPCRDRPLGSHTLADQSATYGDRLVTRQLASHWLKNWGSRGAEKDQNKVRSEHNPRTKALQWVRGSYRN